MQKILLPSRCAARTVAPLPPWWSGKPGKTQETGQNRENNPPAEYAYILALSCVLGCSQDDGPSATDNQEQQEPASVTSENVVYVDMFARGYPTEHPLMCRPGKDLPEAPEMAFRDPESGKLVHAVFPEAAAAPEKLDGSFVLHGHYQGIQNWDAFKPTDPNKAVKSPPEDYEYFVVSSWEQKK